MPRVRPPSVATLAPLAAAVALVATLAFVHDVVKKSWTTGSLPPAGAQIPASGTPFIPPPGPYVFDDRGFLHSSARCDGSLTSAAIARTEASLVTICVDEDGNYTYRGVRLADGAALDVPAETIGIREFVARTDGVTYSLSNQQLVITAGDTIVRREPVIEYHEPHPG